MILLHMKRWRKPILGLVLVAVSVFAIYRVWEKREQEKREAAYQSTLRRYSDSLKPGMTRKDVEGYLTRINLKPQHMCCVSQDRGAWDDLVQIGKEDAPWYCSESNIYVAFQFASQPGRHVMPMADPTDILKAVTLYGRGEGCL